MKIGIFVGSSETIRNAVNVTWRNSPFIIEKLCKKKKNYLLPIKSLKIDKNQELSFKNGYFIDLLLSKLDEPIYFQSYEIIQELNNKYNSNSILNMNFSSSYKNFRLVLKSGEKFKFFNEKYLLVENGNRIYFTIRSPL